MRKAHVLRMFDLHPNFAVSIGQTSRAECEISIVLSQ